jgi:hypothetical protein
MGLVASCREVSQKIIGSGTAGLATATLRSYGYLVELVDRGHSGIGEGSSAVVSENLVERSIHLTS